MPVTLFCEIAQRLNLSRTPLLVPLASRQSTSPSTAPRELPVGLKHLGRSSTGSSQQLRVRSTLPNFQSNGNW